MKTRKRDTNTNDVKKSINIKALRSSTCIDIIDQLPDGKSDFKNWLIACDCCLDILYGKKCRAKRKQTTINPRLRCSQHLTKNTKGDKVTIETLQYNLLCSFTNEKVIDDKSIAVYPSKRTIVNINPSIDGNNSSTPQLIISPNEDISPSNDPIPVLDLPPPIVSPPPIISPTIMPPSAPIVSPSPTTSEYVRIKRQKYCEMKQKADRYDKIINFTKRKQYDFIDYGTCRLIGIAMSFAPMLSLIAAS